MRCDVIIPVGPGHEGIAQDAVASVEMAKICGMGPFTQVDAVTIDDTRGAMGRSAARNKAVRESTADWLYYLDADDLVLCEVFSSLGDSLDHYAAVWGKFGEVSGMLVTERFQVHGMTTLDQILKIGPHCSIKMGHFIRRDVALKHPFHESMNAGEDWEYYLRVWANEKCIKLGGPVVYGKRKGRHSQGPKAATGVEWTNVVNALLGKAIRERQA